jgi:hypothetical protein
LAKAHSEGDYQNQTNGEGESIFMGEMGMKPKEGNLCNKLGSSFMAASTIFPINYFVM